MKRSEMVDIIWNAIAHGDMRANPAEDVLVAIEKAGMLPPKTQHQKPHTHGGYLSLDDALFCGIHKWEPEVKDNK